MNRPLSLAEARARRKQMAVDGTQGNPVNETETVGDRLDQYIRELEDDAGLSRSGFRYMPPPQPEPLWIDKPMGTIVVTCAFVLVIVAGVLWKFGALL